MNYKENPKLIETLLKYKDSSLLNYTVYDLLLDREGTIYAKRVAIKEDKKEDIKECGEFMLLTVHSPQFQVIFEKDINGKDVSWYNFYDFISYFFPKSIERNRKRENNKNKKDALSYPISTVPSNILRKILINIYSPMKINKEKINDNLDKYHKISNYYKNHVDRMISIMSIRFKL